MITKIGYITDTHIDFCQYGLERRRQDFADAFLWAIEDMGRHKVDAAIHSGDIIHTNRPSPHAITVLQQAQRRMEHPDLAFPMLYAPGNHDYSNPHWLTVVNKDVDVGFQLIARKLVELTEYKLKVYGLPNMSRDAFVAEEIPQCDILVCHQAVQEFCKYPSPNALTLPEIKPAAQAVLIGDTHVYDSRPHPLDPKCLVISGGSTELYSESEQDDKYWTLLTFDGVTLVKTEKKSIPTRPVRRFMLKSKEDVDAAIHKIKSENSDVKEGHKYPILIVSFLHTVPDVVMRFRTELDPDKYIHRLSPEFDLRVNEATNEKTTEALKDDLTAVDILKMIEAENSASFQLASQGINPAVDFNAAADTWIEARLKEIENKTS